MLTLIAFVGCTPTAPPVHLPKSFVERLCSAPIIVVGTNVEVDSFVDELSERKQEWSHVRFQVDETFRGRPKPSLHLVMGGPEREYPEVLSNDGLLFPARGLRYVLAYIERTEGGRFMKAGDPGVLASRPVLGSEAEQAALVDAVRVAVEDCG
jgi:hypothetical protein